MMSSAAISWQRWHPQWWKFPRHSLGEAVAPGVVPPFDDPLGQADGQGDEVSLEGVGYGHRDLPHVRDDNQFAYEAGRDMVDV